ncbi:MAG: hypothetical protein LBJ13_01195 [Puniceicoccales bacterium]|jgi:hypothetical protein|nr:hypothetical protein [Puniceicoccales bacterium]
MTIQKVFKVILVGLLMNGNYCNAQRVRIRIIPEQLAEYTSLDSFDQAKNFAMDLSEAKEDQIQIEGDVNAQKIETAVRIVLENTVRKWFPNFDPNGSFASIPDEKKPMLAAFLWEIQEWLFMCSINSALYCLNKLHEIAPSDFDKAKLLLLSQCESERSPNPLDGADWNVIGNAVLMLKREKNGRSEDAKILLGRLKRSDHYEALLGDWTE